MKEKYTYVSSFYTAAGLLYVLAYPFFLVSIIERLDVVPQVILIFAGMIVLPVFIVFFFSSVPAFFKAGKRSVRFGLIRFVTDRIYYDKITDIEITHEYQYVMRRQYYEEIIKFICDDGEHIFHRTMDEIDLKAAAKDPEQLKIQFDSGKFERLKNYILEVKQNA